MSSYIKELKNPKTGKMQKCYCIDDYFGSHKYGYAFPKDGSDADFNKFNLKDCDFYENI